MTRENVYWIRDKLKECIENGWREERKKAFEKKSYCANWDEGKWSGNRAYRSLFVHVPRTGGTSIQNAMKDYSVFPDHHLAKDIKLKQLYNDFFFYTILRNPYERMVSFYEYTFRDWGYVRKLLAFYQSTKESDDLINYKEGQSIGFEEIAQLPGITKEDVSFERFVSIVTEELWDIMWEPQTSYIFDDDEKIIVDYIGKTETLQQDVDNIIKEINKRNEVKYWRPLPSGELIGVKSKMIEEEIEVPHENFTVPPTLYSLTVEHSHYRSYYNDNIRKKVEKYYEKDIEYLKVKF